MDRGAYASHVRSALQFSFFSPLTWLFFLCPKTSSKSRSVTLYSGRFLFIYLRLSILHYFLVLNLKNLLQLGRHNCFYFSSALPLFLVISSPACFSRTFYLHSTLNSFPFFSACKSALCPFLFLVNSIYTSLLYWLFSSRLAAPNSHVLTVFLSLTAANNHVLTAFRSLTAPSFAFLFFACSWCCVFLCS